MFENKGEVVGVSNPHPHCQIYATNFVFKTIEIGSGRVGRAPGRARHASLFRTSLPPRSRTAGACSSQQRRALSFVPYFARYPYETYVAPRATHASIADLDAGELERLRRRCFRKRSFGWRICGGCRFPM